MALLLKLAGKKATTNADDAELNSIIANLNNVLGSKRDYGFFLQKFGLSDYKYLGSSDYVAKALIAEITENIELFEPRIVLNEIVQIKHDRLFHLAFRLDCRVRNKPHTIKLFLNPALNRYQVQL
ncbi:MAG: GPW/gp25 family protein [Methylobacter sp.]|nr:GPW/gp25 family protein [Methylobacter sp.]MDP2429910.1 GPW/gp25 family protein [Methylobacter sp.]MDP3053173.1 GPW/gp25 family protein [Methylobacter sp.]MDP3360558.1 GPW/gp25 family protein [Methylobacter sp.]MDZ4220980.1 GPW/gp25 family protein [Methylobacter sp.]